MRKEPIPRPGPHPKKACMPLLLLVKRLGYAETSREARKLIKAGEIVVDGKIRRDHKYPVGLFDVIHVPRMKKYFLIIPKKGDFMLKKIQATDMKLCRINNKTAVKGGKIQLNMHDGKNILLAKNKYQTGDSLLVKIPELRICKHLKLTKGCLIMITGGKNIGKLATFREIKKDRAVVKVEERYIEIPSKFVFVVGDKKPIIPL